MARKGNSGYVNPAMPPYLTYEEQVFVERCVSWHGDLTEIARQFGLTAEDCERMAADPRVKAEYEYRMSLPGEFLQGKTVEPRPGHDPLLEVEHIANAYTEAARYKENCRLAAAKNLRSKDSRRRA